MIESALETLNYKQLEAQYHETLREYRKCKGLSAALRLNERLTEGVWNNDPTEARIEVLIAVMKREMENA